MSAAIIIPHNQQMYIEKTGNIEDGFIELGFKDIDQNNILMSLSDNKIHTSLNWAYINAHALIVTRDSTRVYTQIIYYRRHGVGYEFTILVYAKEP